MRRDKYCRDCLQWTSGCDPREVHSFGILDLSLINKDHLVGPGFHSGGWGGVTPTSGDMFIQNVPGAVIALCAGLIAIAWQRNDDSHACAKAGIRV